MKPLIAIFCPPLYFLIQSRYLAAAIHFVVWCIAILTALIIIGFFIWAAQASMATWDLRKQLQEEQVTAIAAKMAAVMRPQGTSNGGWPTMSQSIAVLALLPSLAGCSQANPQDVEEAIKARIHSTWRGIPEGSFVAISDNGYRLMVDDGLFSLHDGDIGREAWTPQGEALIAGIDINSDDCMIVLRANDRIANCAFVKSPVSINVTLAENLAFPSEGQTVPMYFSMTYDAPSSIDKYLVQGATGTASVTRLDGEYVVTDITEFSYVDPTDAGYLGGTYFPNGE